MKPWKAGPFLSLWLYLTLSLSRLQLMELSVLIHHMASTQKNPTAGPLHKYVPPPRRLSSPHRLVILQISAILSLPCPPNLGRSLMSIVCTL